jgi:nitrite reductase/ring-hydroxylating ferredoxin subunit
VTTALGVRGVPVCELGEIPEGLFKIVILGDVEIGLTQSGGRVYAVRNICPHMSAPICRGRVLGTMLPSNPGEFVFGLDDQVVVCPWHQWEFSLETGRPVFTNAKGRLRLYPVEVHEGRVHIDVDARVRGED